MNNKRGQINRDSWLWNAPDYFARWRVFPRAFILVYFWLIIEVSMWFMGLPTPSTAQAEFASSIVSAGAAWFGLYVNSGTTPIYNNQNASQVDTKTKG